jgi:hypothetical protein
VLAEQSLNAKDAAWKKLRRLLPQAAGVGGAIYFVFHCVMVLSGTERYLMEWLYDDSFYYLIVAKHFSEAHVSSFDGVTVTSGYHPLWMWLCSVVYGIRGRLDLTYVKLCMGITICISMGLLVIALWKNIRREDNGWLWALALGATSYSALNNGLTVMEWPLVVLCWMMLHLTLMQSRNRSLAERSWLVYAAFLLGVAGSLSRSDFGLIPVCYVCSGTIVAKRFKDWSFVPRASAALAGAIVGFGLVSLYSHAMTGSWVQQSARIKRLAALVADPFNPIPALWQFLRVIFYLPRLDLSVQERSASFHILLPILGVVVAVGIMLTISRRARLREKLRSARWSSPSEAFALTSAALGVLGYLVVYSFNSQATYGWYTSTVTGFVLILVAKLISLVDTRLRTAILIPVVALNIAVAEYSGGNARTQYQENSIGMLMHREHPNARMGGGDVGKPSFYNGGDMFNLDGLMNNEVGPYLSAGTVHCYLLKRKIEYLSDVGSITEPLTDAERAKLGKFPLPWNLYFIPVEGVSPTGFTVSYLKVNFDAIRKSGECSNDLP